MWYHVFSRGRKFVSGLAISLAEIEIDSSQLDGWSESAAVVCVVDVVG